MTAPLEAAEAVEASEEPSSRPRRRRRRKRRRGRSGGAARGQESGPPTGPAEAAARRIGIERLYGEQDRVIECVLEGKDVLVVLPTGFGKSACYQVPALLLPKPTVLVSPLLSLIRDQHEKLLKLDYPVVRVDGTIRGKARKEALARIEELGSVLVMTTPETLGSPDLAETLKRTGVSLAAIDEAHCISAWGHDFRPAYLQLGERLAEFGEPALMALTATATEHVRDDITRYLGLRDPVRISGSPHRANLAFEVIEARSDARLRALMRLSRRLRRPGIIYCSTTREVDNVYAALRLLRIPAHRYHGKMTAKERNSEQELYMKSGRRTVMVATNAFGLGIDKPDIRFIVHYQAPASLESYVQEAGRAGRDGKRSNCILLYDPDDRQIHEALQNRSRIRPEQLYKLGATLAAWAGENRTPTIDALAISAGQASRSVEAQLATLAEAGIVELVDGEARTLIPTDQVEAESRTLAGHYETLRTQDSRRLDKISEYATTTECRAVLLRRYFGEEDGPPCDVCDICRGRPERPDTFWAPIATPEYRKKKLKKRAKRRGRRSKGKKGGEGSAKQASGANGANASKSTDAGQSEPKSGEGGKSRAPSNDGGTARDKRATRRPSAPSSENAPSSEPT